MGRKQPVVIGSNRPEADIASTSRQGENYALSVKTHSTSQREGHFVGVAARSFVGWVRVFRLFLVEHGPVHYSLSDSCVLRLRDRHQQTRKAQI